MFEKINYKSNLQISLAFGLAVFIGVHLTSSLSGGNLNPAVTFGLFLTGRIGLFKLVFYVIAQCLGGIGMSKAFVFLI